MNHYLKTIEFDATETEKTIDIGFAGHCLVEVQNGSYNALGSLFLVSWNGDAFRAVNTETVTQNVNPKRPSNGSSEIKLSNLMVGYTYTIFAMGFLSRR